MIRRSVVVTLVVGSLALAACGGSERLAPLRDGSGSAAATTPTTAPATAVRSLLKGLVAVATPAGYENIPPDLDVDPGSLSSGLKSRFDGTGMQWGMRRNWADGAGDRLQLAVFAFAGPDGARQAFDCGCGGDPTPGLPGGVISRDAASAELSVAVGSFLVVVLAEGDRPAAAPVLTGMAQVVRSRVIALGGGPGGLVGAASSGGTAV